MTETIHIGRKISRIRELKGLKQETLAAELGISQQAVSKIEQSPNLEDETLEKVAKALGITPDAVRHFNEDSIFNNMNNTFHDNSTLNNSNYQCTFNAIDKVIELYERLLKSEQEKVEILKKKNNLHS